MTRGISRYEILSAPIDRPYPYRTYIILRQEVAMGDKIFDAYPFPLDLYIIFRCRKLFVHPLMSMKKFFLKE